MRRLVLPPLAALAVLIGAACGGREVVLPSPSASPVRTTSSPSPSPSPSTSPRPSPTPTLDLELPRDAPEVLAEPLDPEDLAAEAYAPLLPPGASMLAVRTGAEPLTVAVAWYRGEDPFARETGVVVWQRLPEDPPWRAVYAFTDRPARGVLGISLEQADLTGDGIPDLLTREDTGGTGACATWRVVAPHLGGAAEVWRHAACDTEVRISRGRLLVREAVYGPDDPHCCPSGFRLRWLVYDGTSFAETRVRSIDV